MGLTETIQPLLDLGEPLTSPLLALAAALCVPGVLRRTRGVAARLGWLAAGLGVFGLAYHAACRNGDVARWLAALNTPLVAVYLFVILPAMYLPRGKGYRFFLVVPGLVLAAAVAGVFDAYGTAPAGQGGFYWFLIRPAFLMGGVASLLVLIEPFVSLKWFRFSVRCACLLVLVYGGFAFRKDYADYEGMLQRRRDAAPGIMNIVETSPVLKNDGRMTYLPSAPCRFTADGGYVQGCVMELGQRVMQVNYSDLAARKPGAIRTASLLGGTMVLFLVMCFVGARWFCGWVCPLSTLGGVLDWCRRRLGLPHVKPGGAMRLVFPGVGLALVTITFLMAAAVPYVDESNTFAGWKIPEYPFCKICPSQQICPVAAGGPSKYEGLPTAEWGFGFFRYGCIGLVCVFVISFLMGRRLWCRLCPMGMISGVFNRGGMFRLVKDAAKCNRCGMCAEVCPMAIDTVRAAVADRDASCFDCVLCLKCVEVCPRDGCLAVEHGGVKLTESRFEVMV